MQRCGVRARQARERTNWRCRALSNEAVLELGDVALAVRAILALDFPTRDTQLLSTRGEVAGGAAGANEMVPAMLARKDGDTQFGNTHSEDMLR